MLLLTSTSDKIQVVTDSTANLDVHASWVDNASGTITPARTNSAISSATTTDVVASPAGSTQRNVKTLSLRNRHASTSVTVTVKHTDGTTAVELFKAVLAAGEKAEYSTETGWRYYDSTGMLKATSVNDVRTSLAADQSNSTTTPTEVTGLSVTLQPGTYKFAYDIIYQAAATTTGVRFSVNFGGTVTSFVANQKWADASATASTAAPTQAGVGAAGQVLGVMSARAKSTAGWGTTISVDSANADMYMEITGIMVVTVAGTIQLWHGSEVAAASTIKAGSGLVIQKVG